MSKPRLSPQDFIEWVARHEQEGHVFYYCHELQEAIHLVPSRWLDFGQAEYFKSLYGDELTVYLYARAVKLDTPLGQVG